MARYFPPSVSPHASVALKRKKSRVSSSTLSISAAPLSSAFDEFTRFDTLRCYAIAMKRLGFKVTT